MKILVIVTLGVSLIFASVDINTADKDELIGLNGIGAKKAEAIIEYRSSNCFDNISELANVKGIGSKIIEKNKSNLSASECKT